MASEGEPSMSDETAADAGERSGRSYRITVRGEEVMRYTLPDFFPDFNETPLEARINSGADTRMKAQGGTGGGGGGGGGGSKSYVWKRGVLAGTERSDPLDVIAKDRERFERTLGGEGREFAPADEDSNDVDSGLTNAGGSGPRRAIPPPPGYAERPLEEPGAVTKSLAALTLFFYLTALVATSSRSILGDGPPAPMPGMERALEVPPPPEAIVGTAAGEAWSSGVERFRVGSRGVGS